MQIVIADTGPINYLILIGNIDLLPVLFDRVILPSAVQAESTDPDAPPSVRRWIGDHPAWLAVHETASDQSKQVHVEGLDDGETAEIALAVSLDADLLLMDERKGVMIARAKGLRVTGTLGVLDLAAQRALINFAQAVDRLRRTTFRISEALLDSLTDRENGCCQNTGRMFSALWSPTLSLSAARSRQNGSRRRLETILYPSCRYLARARSLMLTASLG